MYLTETYLTEEQGLEKIVGFLVENYDLEYVDEVVDMFESLTSYDMDYILNEEIIYQYLQEMSDTEDVTPILEGLEYNDIDYIIYEGVEEYLTEVLGGALGVAQYLGKKAKDAGKAGLQSASRGVKAAGRYGRSAAGAVGNTVGSVGSSAARSVGRGARQAARYGRSAAGAAGNTVGSVGSSIARGVAGGARQSARYGRSVAGAVGNTGRGLASRVKQGANAAGKYAGSVAGALGNTAKEVGRNISKAAKSTYKKARDTANELRGKVTSAYQKGTDRLSRGVENLSKSEQRLGKASRNLKSKVGSAIANSGVGKAYAEGEAKANRRKAANAAAKEIDKATPRYTRKNSPGRSNTPLRREVSDNPPQRNDYYRYKAKSFQGERGKRPYGKMEDGKFVARSGKTNKELNTSARGMSGFRNIPAGIDPSVNTTPSGSGILVRKRNK